MQVSKISLPDSHDWKSILLWANQYKYCCYFTAKDEVNYPYGAFPNIVAIGDECLEFYSTHIFEELDHYFYKNPENQIFGYFSYDLFEETHKIKSQLPAIINWPKASFFLAHTIIEIKDDHLEIKSNRITFIKNALEEFFNKKQSLPTDLGSISTIKQSITKDQYINTVNKLKRHIEDGDVYEINFCMNNYAESKDFAPLVAFYRLIEKSPTPFGSFLKCRDQYVVCASPERFLKRIGEKIISQPIKGTAKRSRIKEEDELLRNKLFNSEKERAENMMIVDLVRNDLSQSAISGTVKVEELFGLYSFKYVHQMISTVTAIKKNENTSLSVIKKAFPMGSMTGAPKKSAIELIEKYEKYSRGVFSGSIGYFDGATSFDFNVVIRSLFYDATTNQLNYQIGSAITYDSVAEDEYDECLLKAQAIKELLTT